MIRVKVADAVLILCCLVLLAAGPAMALQELAQAEEDAGVSSVTGERAPTTYDAPFRGWWRGALFLVLVVAGAAGFFLSVRIARQPRVRQVSGRLLALLLIGMTLFDLAFLADGRWFLSAPYQARAATIVWAYPLAAILMGGATLRLAEVERAFADARPTS